MELQAEWAPDCQGKQDFDANLVILSSRFYPQGGGWSELSAGRWLENKDRPEIMPNAVAHIYLQDMEIATASFEGNTEAEVKAKLESWAREQFAKIVCTISAAFKKRLRKDSDDRATDLAELLTKEFGAGWEDWDAATRRHQEREIKRLDGLLTAVQDALDYLHGLTPQQAAEFRADAERYRWLLDQHERINQSEASIWERMMRCKSLGWTLDEFIDAERGKA